MDNEKQLREEINVIKSEGETTRKLITDHITIYQKNGQAIRENNKLIQDHIEMDLKRWEDLKPMLENYKTIVNGSKLIRGIAYFIVAVGIIGTFLWRFIK